MIGWSESWTAAGKHSRGTELNRLKSTLLSQKSINLKHWCVPFERARGKRERDYLKKRESTAVSLNLNEQIKCASVFYICVIRPQHAANLHPESWRVWSIHHCVVSSRSVVFFCESDKNKTGFCVIECCTIGFSLSEEWDFQAPRRNGIITQTHKKAFFYWSCRCIWSYRANDAGDDGEVYVLCERWLWWQDTVQNTKTRGLSVPVKLWYCCIGKMLTGVTYDSRMDERHTCPPHASKRYTQAQKVNNAKITQYK